MHLRLLFIKLITLVIGFTKGIGGIIAVFTLFGLCFQISTIPILFWDSVLIRLITLLLFPIAGGIFYYIHTLIPKSSNLRFSIRIRQKLIVILFLTTAIILPTKLTNPGFYDGLRLTTFILMILFCYEEFRRLYLVKKSGLYWPDYTNGFTLMLGELLEPIMLFLLYCSVIVIMNPFYSLSGIQKETWIIIDMLAIIFVLISLLKDFKIGFYLGKEYLIVKKMIEDKNDISLELKLFVCENYSIGTFRLPEVNYSSENPRLRLEWSDMEKAVLGIDLPYF